MCFTVILCPGAHCKCVYCTLLKTRGQCPLQFWCLLCLGIWLTLNSSSEVLAECGLSGDSVLEHVVQLLCNRRCGSNKTLSQDSSSSAAVMSNWGLIAVPVHKQLKYLIWIRQVKPLADRFQSLSLLRDCAVCTENVKFSFRLLLPCCPHKLHTYLTCEIQCVYKQIEGNWNAHYIR